MRKNLYWLFMVLIVAASLHSGCGGSSGGSVPNDNENQQQQNTTPNTPDTPSTIYPFSTLAGTWTASNGSGTISGISGTAAGGAVTLSDAEISFSNIEVSGNTATVNMAVKTIWDWSYGNTNYRDETNTHPNNAQFQRVNGNTWRWSRTDTPYPDETIIITITSPTTATVEQGLNPKHNYDDGRQEVYRLATSFTITKQNTTTNSPSTIYGLSTLAGTWTPSNGTATMIGSGENHSLTMRADGGSYSFGNVQASGNTATVSVNGLTQWAYDSGRNFDIDYIDEAAQFQRNSGNIWNWTHNYDNDDESRTITITSPTTAIVEEELNLVFRDTGKTYRWTARYTLTKQSNTTPNTPTTGGTLNGTWRITGGRLTYDVPGNDDEANYVQGSASAETFTLALSDAGDGSYVLTVSGSGVSEKEGAPYVEAYFEGIDDEVRVVWGTSEDWKDAPATGGGNSTFAYDNSTYSAQFQTWVHDVNFASYQLTNASTIRYTHRGPSIHDGSETSTKVELTLERVN